MAGDVLRALLRKKSGTPRTGRGLASPKRIRRDAVIERRDRCMTQLGLLRHGKNVSGTLADKAHHLLTAHWAASSWRARADILRTAEWLLGISRKVGCPSPPARPSGQDRNKASDPHDAQHQLDAVVP